MVEQKKRLDPTGTTLRSLYIASGGVCEMQDCNKRLTQPSGAWIGTVAHIVSAEDNGPRADGSMDPEDRRNPSNLMLLCADHGREVDDRQTGEKLYPRERLEEIKRTHEARFSGLIDDMLTSSRSRVRSVDDFIDTAVGASVVGRTCAKFAEYWNLADGDPGLLDQARREFEESRRTLSHLSRAALGTLSWLLGVWESTLESAPRGSRDFGQDWWGRGYLEIHESLIHNRELNPMQLRSALGELEQRGILWLPSSDDDEYQELKYSIGSPWSTEWTTWRRIAEYLDRAHLSTVSDWVKGLDYSVFDDLSARNDPGSGVAPGRCFGGPEPADNAAFVAEVRRTVDPSYNWHPNPCWSYVEPLARTLLEERKDAAMSTPSGPRTQPTGDRTRPATSRVGSN